MDNVFKALADPTRRAILDQLFAREGQSLQELCEHVAFSRQALSKHLALLERAGLVVTRFRGREKQHFLNPLPIQEISERWLSKYSTAQLSAVTALKQALEDPS